jgi:tRNA A-37 threonylcarbamoyl transferase component Bud32
MEGQRFGRYRVTRTLGSGAMGEVFEAVDDVLGREVAIKTLKAATGITARMFDERFRTEARAIAQLSHPGVVQVFDIDLAAEPPYIVLERVAGPSLGEVLDERGRLDTPALAALGIQMARALAAAHAAGVVHRDVKPSNILAAGAGSWKLADFGVAHVPDSALTMTGQFVGSPAYAAPEALVKGISAAAGDVYGLGATLYQAAAGRWPRLEANGAILAPVPPVAELVPELPPHLAAAIDRAVALDHEQRPTAAELADLIAGTATSPGVAAAEPVAAATEPPVAAEPRHVRWQPIAGIGAILLVLAILFGTCHGSRAPDHDRSTAAQPDPLDEPAPAGELRVVPPEGLEANSHAARDWNKVVDQLRKGHLAEARKKLGEWEDHWGATPETSDLRRQLEGLPDEPERDHGKHKHGN